MKLLASLLTAAALAAPVFSAFAAGDAPKAAKPDLVKGEASFTAVCAACHGADGNSAIAANPKLSQQHPEYLVKQLQEFKSGKRADPIMAGMAAILSDEDMKNVSYWLASQKAKPGAAKDKELDYYLSEGIRKLQAERDALAAELAAIKGQEVWGE